MPFLDHIHPYIFWKKFGDERVFKCSHPDCEETRVQSYLEGKRGMCAVCQLNPLVYTKQDLRRSRPRCPECSNTKENREKRKIKSLLEEMPDFAIKTTKEDTQE